MTVSRSWISIDQCKNGFQIRSLLEITIRIQRFLFNHPVLEAIVVGELGYLGEKRKQ
jgi:hypothetical protein